MVILLTLTLSLSLLSFNNPVQEKPGTEAKMLNPVAIWTDPNGVFPDTYFYDYAGPDYCLVNHSYGGPFSLFWTGEVIQIGNQICANIWVYWSGTPYQINACIDIVEM